MRRTKTTPAPSPPLPLRVNDLLFLNEYFRNGRNGVKAYQFAHPKASYHVAGQRASKVLQKDVVQQEIARRTRYDVGITKEWGQTRLLDYEGMALTHGDYVAGASIVMDGMRLAGFLVEKRQQVEPLSVTRQAELTQLLDVAMNGHPPAASEPATEPTPTESATDAASVSSPWPGVDCEATPPHPTASVMENPSFDTPSPRAPKIHRP